MKDFYKIYTVTIISLALLLYNFDNSNHLIEQEKTYTFAVYPQYRSQQLFQVWQPILKRLKEETGLKFKLTGNSEPAIFEKTLANGNYDLAYVNPYHAAKAGKNGNYKAILNDKEEKTEGILVVKRGKIKSLSQLKNQTIGFPSPNTLASSIILKQELQSKLGKSTKAIYLKNPLDVYMKIHNDKISGGGGTKKTFDKLMPSIKKQLTILYTTQPVPAHPIIANSKLPKTIRGKVISAFLKMSKNPKDKILLKRAELKNINTVNQNVYDKLDIKNGY